MTSFKTFALAGIAAIALAATPASATELLYNFTSTSGTDDFSFTLDSNPTPDVDGGGDGFAFLNYLVTTSAGAETFTLQFHGSNVDGGLQFLTPTSTGYYLLGFELFSGLTSAPTMLTGDFALYGSRSVEPLTGYKIEGTLTVTELSAAVPEPGTWAMMLLGFGAVGFSMRKARQAKAVLQAA